jgi:hypothetical protein
MLRYTTQTIVTCSYLSLASLASPLSAQQQQAPPSRLEFTRMVAHWAEYGDPEYLNFIDEAQPELVQLGFYGAHFWSLAHTKAYKGYPAHFPVQGLDECGDWFEAKNKALDQRGIKVVGHFNVEFLVGDPEGPEGPTGFFKFYRELWDEKRLGQRPVDDPLELLEKNADGTPISQPGYGIGGMREYWGCLRNPAWRQVLKVWVKQGVERGVDGFIANYFYRHNCLCEHCQRDFRAYLKQRFTAAELNDKFGIDDLTAHRFEEIVAWHKPEESTPLRREMLRFSQISNKQAFDEVLIQYGRSLKPDLIVAQWNHLSNFSQIGGDERCLLPTELWGKGESYAWYSTGAASYYSDLENRFLGDATLQARYVRGALDDRPYTLGKYEGTRIRMAIAELAANGGAPMGFYTRFTDPLARQEIARYYRFMKRHDELFHANLSHAEALLLFPRSRVHEGDVAAVEAFKQAGRELLDRHVLFDVLADEAATPQRRKAYRIVIGTDGDYSVPESFSATLSAFDAPYTVRVSASRPAKSDNLTLHLVNYNREEPPKDKQGKPTAGRGIADEKPIAVERVGVDLLLPGDWNDRRVQAVELLTPEAEQPSPLEFEQFDGRLRFTVPEFLVYGVVRIK